MKTRALLCTAAFVALVMFGAVAIALEAPPSFLFHILGTTRVSQMAQTTDGRILAPSMNGNVVNVFTEAGGFVNDFGSGGTALGQFDTPTGVAIDQAGNIYICDQFNHRVQKFSASFLPLLSMGSQGSGPGQLSYPTNCAFSPDESRLYVSELGNHRVSMFDKNGNFLGSFGSFGSAPGQFNY